MTICSQIQSQLGAYLTRTIPDKERKIIQSHLAECPVCQAELENLANLHHSLRQSLRKGATLNKPDPRLRERIRFRVSRSWRGGTTHRDYQRLLATGEAQAQPGSPGWISARISAVLAFIRSLFTRAFWLRLPRAIRAAAAQIRARLRSR